MKKIYQNPILHLDYSDPDVIRVEDDFYMVASSFNHTPMVPILHSKDLVNWEIINYVSEYIPFERFKDVCHGDGAWAPSIRYHDGYYYVIIPFPDEGIYVSKTKDIYGSWSPLWCLIDAKGVIDPCPIWKDNKCYLAVGFAKSRIGFNSVIGVYEVSNDLTKMITDYKIVYDGHNDNPTIEGPKFNTRNGYIYIMAPAGSVKGGWQVALRSKNIYGPYESKIVLLQNDTLINGPHQGALLTINESDEWAFLHFQDKRAYGRIVHLEPVTWYNDWPIIGDVKDPLLGGSPVAKHSYLLPKCYLNTDNSDDFKNELSLVWQTPANKIDKIYDVNNGLKLYALNDEIKNLNMLPNLLLQKVSSLEFDITTEVDINLVNDGDELGFTMMGTEYSYLCVVRKNGNNYLNLRTGKFNEDDKTIYELPYHEKSIIFHMMATNNNIYDLLYKYSFNNIDLPNQFKATAGRWIGAKHGIYVKGTKGSFGLFKYYLVSNKGE